jgi:hypothetical protein
MRNIFFIFLVLFTISSFSQVVIKGTVFQQNGPLENVAVYLNNTMLGTTTDKNGKFSISVKPGQYDLIISYLGFKKINYNLNTASYSKPLVFALEEDDEMLDEIIIKKTVYNEEWRHNLAVFKTEFLGKTELAKDCKILNSEVLHFEYNSKTQILTAFARKPLLLKNNALGYSIIYELEHFERTKEYVTYLGYSRYKELKGGKRKQKRWKKNRLKAYNGSPVHFFKSLLKDEFTAEGFIVNQFKRVPNPERPTELEISSARELIKLHRSSQLIIPRKNTKPTNALDSAWVIVSKAKLPKNADYLYKSQLQKEDIITSINGAFKLSFENNISIVYKNELEEMGFLTRNIFSKKRASTFQTSSLIPMEKNIYVDKNGVLVNPLSVFYEGYWSYEKYANSLPLDYEPVDSSQ